MTVSRLEFESSTVGYRVKVGEKRFLDADIDSVFEALGYLPSTDKTIPLKDYDGVLMSRYEYQGVITVRPVEHPDHIRKFFGVVPSGVPLSMIGSGEETVVLEVGNIGEYSEYETLSSVVVFYIVVNSMTQLNKITDSLRLTSSEKKDLLSKYQEGNRVFKFNSNSSDYYTMCEALGYVQWYITKKEGFLVRSINRYEGTEVTIKLIPPNFNYSSDGDSAYERIGASANDQSVSSYVKDYIEEVKNGGIKYFDGSIRDIERKFNKR